MGNNRTGNRIETLIATGEWAAAQRAIKKQLGKEPDDHWLWSRLSGVKYEQCDYQGALDAAEKALKIVPDCLARMGKPDEAVEWYGRFLNLLHFGMQGIYSRKDAKARLKKLASAKKTMPDVMERMRELEEVMG